MNRKVLRVARFIHKWAGLLLAIQLLFWILGGLVMSAIPLEKVHGKHLAALHLANPFKLHEYTYSLDALVKNTPALVHAIHYRSILARPVYLFDTSEGQRAYDAQTGEYLTHFDNDTIGHIAQQHYLGSGVIKTVTLLEQSPQEVGKANEPIWSVEFTDAWTTTLYVSPSTAQVVKVRSDIWRIFDFFWMLHIMDYDERENINNPLLIGFSASALLFTITGIVLLFHSFRLRRRVK